MSINDRSAPQSNQPQQGRQQSAGYSSRDGVAAINERLFFGNRRSAPSSNSKNLQDALIHLAQNTGELPFHLGITLLDNVVSNVALSGIIFETENQGHVITSTLLFEGSEVRDIKPITVDFRGTDMKKMEMPRPVTDLYDADTTDAIEQLIREQHSGKNVTIIDAGANYVSLEVSRGKTKEELIESENLQELLFYALNNIIIKLDEINNTTDACFSLDMITNDQNARVRANIDKNPAPLFNANGLPVRADFCITLGATSNDNNEAAKYSTSTDLTVTCGYIDLTYADPRDVAAERSRSTGIMVDPNSIPQSYIPRAVLTRIDSAMQVASPEFSLLALATATTLSTGQQWIGMFAPRYGVRGSEDLRDVGAIGFEATNLTEGGVPARIDVKSDAFASNPANLTEFITTAIHPTLVYSQDIIECSDLGAIDTMFLAAADGVPAAYEAVIKHADNLTNGRFSSQWAGGPIAYNTGTAIPVGYYEDKDGNRQDLRKIDYLAMLNLMGERDLSVVEKYSKLLDDTNLPYNYRVAELRELLISVVGYSVTIKGIAWRIDYAPEFLATLSKAIADSHLRVEANSIGAYNAVANRRGNATALNYAIKMQQAAGFVNYGGAGYAGHVAQPTLHNPWQRS